MSTTTASARSFYRIVDATLSQVPSQAEVVVRSRVDSESGWGMTMGGGCSVVGVSQVGGFGPSGREGISGPDGRVAQLCLHCDYDNGLTGREDPARGSGLRTADERMELAAAPNFSLSGAQTSLLFGNDLTSFSRYPVFPLSLFSLLSLSSSFCLSPLSPQLD